MNGHNLPWLDTPWEPEALREEPLEELLDRSVEFEQASDGLFDKLCAIRVSLSESGVSVTVTLDGQLVGLTLTDEAIELGGERLAAQIHKLTTDAAAAALSQGIAVLTPVVGIEVAEQLSAATGLDELNARAAAEAAEKVEKAEKVEAPAAATAPRPRRPVPDDDEDFSTMETWAVRD